jgi:hypothetical protein
MKFLFRFSSRPTHRARLRDLHAFGLVHVFRRPSLFRLWEPLREHPGGGDEYAG